MATTTTSAAPSATSTAATGGPPGGGGSSSPLLFFVALGFGVVFTNLWIIVGVKYCFRYNQRNRALGRGPQVDGDPIDLTVMARPHRRRREKKLMTVEDMNTRFPIMKYKAWRASREHEGLPAAGGITAPPSRAASMKDVEGVIGDAKLRSSSDHDRPGSSLSQTARTTLRNSHPQVIPEHGPITEKSIIETSDVDDPDKSKTATTVTSTADSTVKSKPNEHTDASDDEDEDPIADATSPELIAVPGDTCAICLDTLEDDDDVRGLTCGHAFHAACIEPWLTGRRASCPLCKADYYIPKPKPEGEVDNTAAGRRNQSRMNLPQSPRNAWLIGRMPSRSRLLILTANPEPHTARATQNASSGNTEQSSWRSRLPFGNTGSNNASNNTATTTPTSNSGSSGTWMNPFRRNQAAIPAPTPAQLEAGTR